MAEPAAESEVYLEVYSATVAAAVAAMPSNAPVEALTTIQPTSTSDTAYTKPPAKAPIPNIANSIDFAANESAFDELLLEYAAGVNAIYDKIDSSEIGLALSQESDTFVMSDVLTEDSIS